jgi:hypothetical protein
MTVSEDRIVIEVKDSPFWEVNDYLYRNRLTDGLPVIPPTSDLVQAAIAESGRDPEEVIGEVPPLWSPATVEKIAINCVMAGCEPQHLPVVIAAVEAVTDPVFNLYGIQATTNPEGPFIIVNGPRRHSLGINCGSGALGPGWRANAAIGRAMRLILMNVGGAFPGELDKSTLGFPGKYTMCCGENEEENPWEPFHVEKGWPAESTVVTVTAANATVNVVDTESKSAAAYLRTLAGSVAIQGTNNFAYGGSGELFVLMCPEWAQVLAEEGYNKRQVKEYIWRNATIPLESFSPDVADAIRRKYAKPWLADGLVRVTESPDDIQIVVVGGPGPHTTLVFSPHRPPVMREVKFRR